VVSKNTILTEKRLVDIEDIIAVSGKIVTANDIHKALAQVPQLKNKPCLFSTSYRI